VSASRRRRVAVVTGTRAEYGLLRSTLEAVSRHRRLKLQIVVTGMHLLEKFGRTVDEIESDGWPIAARIPMQAGDDSPRDQADGLARGVTGLSRFFEEADPDVVVVLGDRIEALAAALAAVTTRRFVAHVHGGDVAVGDFDDGLRHAITKLAHIHLAASKRAARRILRLGEHPDHVHVVGAPGLDRLYEILRSQILPSKGRLARSRSSIPSDDLVSGGSARAEARGSGSSGTASSPLLTSHFSLPASPFSILHSQFPHPIRPRTALVLHHPLGRSPAVEQRTMNRILSAVADNDLSAVVIYPNSDRGHTGIIAAIKQCAASKRMPIRMERSLARDDFLRLLTQVRVLVGNSSAGILEAASAGTPTVNVGTRQQGRERPARGVVDCGETRAEIRSAITRALRLRLRPGAPTCYGDGRAGERIAEVLARTRLDERLRRKQIAY